MRKLISIPMVFVFLFNLGGYYLWFSAIQYGVQKEIEEEIAAGSKDEDLILIVMPDKGETGLVWLKPNKEFRYKGEMFDVVKIKKLPGKKHFYCLNDRKEKELIAAFNTTHNTKNESAKKLKRTFDYNLYFQMSGVSKNAYPTELTFTPFTDFYLSNATDIHLPPPKTA